MKKTLTQAFTLIEILITVAVIGVLMTLLVPGYKSAMTSANRAKCVANLKAIGQSLTVYASENNGTTVYAYFNNSSPQGNWAETLTRWDGTFDSLRSGNIGKSRGIWQCPENRKQILSPTGSGGGEKEGSYAINGSETETNNNDPNDPIRNRYVNNKLANFTEPSKLYMVIEGVYFLSEPNRTGGVEIVDPLKAYTGQGMWRIRYAHNKGLNIVFADGHVELVMGPLGLGTSLGGPSAKAASYSNGANWFAN